MAFNLTLTKTPSQIFSKRLVQIKYIQHIQNDLIDKEVAKLNLKLTFLSQSYVIHLVAFWQTFIEDLVKFSYAELAKKTDETTFSKLAKARIDDALKRFNTPNPENIDKLFKETLNIEKITTCWSWEGTSRNQAIVIVNELLKMRHRIAHAGYAETLPTYDENFEIMNQIFQIANLTERYVFTQLKQVQ